VGRKVKQPMSLESIKEVVGNYTGKITVSTNRRKLGNKSKTNEGLLMEIWVGGNHTV